MVRTGIGICIRWPAKGVLATKGVDATRNDADATFVAMSPVSAVKLLLHELRPLVGELAACALYKRSLHLARSSFQRATGDAQTHDELLAPLYQDLSYRSSADAQKAARALLNSLADLLVSMIGEPLTYRLLRKAWGYGQMPPATEENAQ